MTARLHRGGHAVRHARRQLIRAAGGLVLCARCGQPIDTALPGTHPRGLQVGHRIAQANGGSDELGNLQPEHGDCNRAASNRRDELAIERSPAATIVAPIFPDEAAAGDRKSVV